MTMTTFTRSRGLALVLALAVAGGGCMFGVTGGVTTDTGEQKRTSFMIAGIAVGAAALGTSLLILIIKHPKELAKGMGQFSRAYAQDAQRRRAATIARERDRKRTEDRYRANNPYHGGTRTPPNSKSKSNPPRTPPTKLTPPGRPKSPLPTTGGPPIRAGWEGPKGGVTVHGSSGGGGNGGSDASAGNASGSSGGGSSGGGSSSGGSSSAGKPPRGSGSSSGGSTSGDGGKGSDDATGVAKQERKRVTRTFLTIALETDFTEFHQSRETSRSIAKSRMETRISEECHATYDAVPNHRQTNWGPLQCERGGSRGQEWRCRYWQTIGWCEKQVWE